MRYAESNIAKLLVTISDHKFFFVAEAHLNGEWFAKEKTVLCHKLRAQLKHQQITTKKNVREYF